MASAVSASAKAQATKEANQALVAELLTLPFPEQADRIVALRPATRVKQVGVQLAKALLIKENYISKSAEERAAFQAPLPTLHRHYIQIALAKGIPSSSATRKKLRSHSAAMDPSELEKLIISLRENGTLFNDGANAKASGNSPRAAEEGAPSELDKRVQAFRLTDIPFSLLYELTKDEQDREAAQNYAKAHIEAKQDESDSEFIAILMEIEKGDLSQVDVFRKRFKEFIQEYVLEIQSQFRDKNATLKEIVSAIKKNLAPLPVNIDLAELDDKLPLQTYMSFEERHKLTVIYVRSEFTADANKPAVLGSLLEFLGPIVKRLALRKSHGKTRKSNYGLRSKSASANINAAEKVYQKKQMSILGKQDLTWAQKQNALRVLGNERKTYFAPVPFTGPLRDSKGYKQHRAECSTDVISQVLQQGMPWAAIVQERLYNGTAAQFNAMYDRAVTCPGFHPDREDMMALLLNMQERFKLHYTAAKKLEEAAVCVPSFDYTKIGPILTRKVRKSAELGPAILKNVKKLTKAPLYSTHVGYIKHIFQLLFQFFGVTDVECYLRNVRFDYRKNPILYLAVDIQYKDYKHLAFALRINYYPPNYITYHQRPSPAIVGHYTAIYKSLDGSWVYYDNEIGMLPLHPILMGDILNEQVSTWFIAYVYKKENDTKTIEFYKIPYFNSSNIEEMRDKGIEVWREDSWHEVDFREVADFPRLSTFEEHIHIVSKTSEEPGFDGLYIDNV